MPDQLQYADATKSTKSLEVYTAMMPARPFAVDAHVVVDQATDLSSQIALSGNGDAINGLGAACIVRRAPGQLFAHETATNTNHADIPNYDLAAGTAFRLRMVFSDTVIACFIAVDGGAAAEDGIAFVVAPAPAGTLTLSIQSAAMRVDDVTIYQLARP